MCRCGLMTHTFTIVEMDALVETSLLTRHLKHLPHLVAQRTETLALNQGWM